MKLVILPPALAELQEAADFYADRANRDLGLAFVVEFERAATVVLDNLMLGAVFRGSSRRYLLRRFPCSIIYQALPDELRVAAVAHHRRRPGYWASR
jgi:plasmid stabilization system protein ParE